MLTYVVVIVDDFIYIYICCAFVVLDIKLYNMQGAYIKTLVSYQ